MKFLLVLLLINNVYATTKKSHNPLLKTKENSEFFGGSHDVSLKKEPLAPDVALVNKDECLKHKKDGETYWTYYETEILKVEDIGKDFLKVKRFSFLPKSGKWTLSAASSMPFAQQLLYINVECPKKELELTAEELEELNKNK